MQKPVAIRSVFSRAQRTTSKQKNVDVRSHALSQAKDYSQFRPQAATVDGPGIDHGTHPVSEIHSTLA